MTTGFSVLISLSEHTQRTSADPFFHPQAPPALHPRAGLKFKASFSGREALGIKKINPYFRRGNKGPGNVTLSTPSGFWVAFSLSIGPCGSLLLYDKEVEASLMVIFLYFLEAMRNLASDMFPACVVRCLLAWPTPCWLGSWSQSPFGHWPEITGHRTSQDFCELNPFLPHLSSSHPLRKQLQDS